jgi:polyhydroxyalkanoate synthesis regulator phasin
MVEGKVVAMAERRTGTSRASGGSKRAASSKRTAAAKKGGAARGRQQRAQKAGVEAKTVAEFREALRKSLIRPSGMVLLTRERIEEALSKSGKLSPKEARGIASELVKRGRKETDAVLGDLEGLLERGRRDVSKRAGKARKRAGAARGRAVRAASPAIARADRARRAAKVGGNFPISLYEDLNVSQIKAQLGNLTPAELRKVRDHERRNANRKGVLSAIESKLR